MRKRAGSWSAKFRPGRGECLCARYLKPELKGVGADANGKGIFGSAVTMGTKEDRLQATVEEHVSFYSFFACHACHVLVWSFVP